MLEQRTSKRTKVLEYPRNRAYTDLHAGLIAKGEELHPDAFPVLYNLSSAFIYRFMLQSPERRLPEYIYINPNSHQFLDHREHTLHVWYEILRWNLAWEAGHLRHAMFGDELPSSLKWLHPFQDQNIYLVPRFSFHRYEAYAPLFHMLSEQTLKQFGLPALRRGLWPPLECLLPDHLLPKDFDSRLSRAFAYHIWPLINPRTSIKAFSSSDPIKVIVHNLDYWLPYAVSIVEARLCAFPRVEFEDKQQIALLNSARKKMPSDIEVNRPLMGGSIWQGEEEAWEATCEMVESADANGQLRAIIDAVKSNRIEDDFSALWSYEREDFERKLYHKRSKIKVSFVELNDTIPVHGPESEVHDNLIWEDFLALLDRKERRIVICIRNGMTRVGEISKMLGYANHSPVSKALARIRKKVGQYLNSC